MIEKYGRKELHAELTRPDEVKTREIKLQNMRNTENISHIALSTVRQQLYKHIIGKYISPQILAHKHITYTTYKYSVIYEKEIYFNLRNNPHC